jgi:hypothetical protein
MFGALTHLNQEKVKFSFQFNINDLKFFDAGFKLKKVSDDDVISVQNIIFKSRSHIKGVQKEKEKLR